MSEEHALRIGTIRGIPINIEWTLLVIFWLLTWSLAASGLPTLAPGYGGAAYWLAAVATTALFFVSLLAHELSHSVVARSFGIGSAMSCAEALRRCPETVFVRPRKDVYSEHSRAVWFFRNTAEKGCILWMNLP